MTFSEMVKNKQANLLIYEKYKDYNILINLFTGGKKKNGWGWEEDRMGEVGQSSGPASLL